MVSGLQPPPLPEVRAVSLQRTTVGASIRRHTTEMSLLPGAMHSSANTVQVLVQRGPRIRVGIAWGSAAVDVSEATGRMVYRGKLMNRAARIASKAIDGQVLVSGEVWYRAQLVLERMKRHATSPAATQPLPSPAPSPAPGAAVSGKALTKSMQVPTPTPAPAPVSAAKPSGPSQTPSSSSKALVLPKGKALTANFVGSLLLKGIADPVDVYEAVFVPTALAAGGGGGGGGGSDAGDRRHIDTDTDTGQGAQEGGAPGAAAAAGAGGAMTSMTSGPVLNYVI